MPNDGTQLIVLNLSDEQYRSAIYMEIEDYFQKPLAQLMKKNKSLKLSHDTTTEVRSRIAEIEDFFAKRKEFPLQAVTKRPAKY